MAVQSHWFSVGSVVSWAEAGVGAVATQSFAEPAYGPRALDLMRSGLSARQALAALIAVDTGAAERQVAVVDGRGQVAVHTGARCIESASHHEGRGFSVQANMMLSDRVVPAMAEAFEQSQGELAERLLCALQAAERSGGDVRGRQSAAILVVRGRMSGALPRDRLLDLRVDDHAEPVRELVRLLTLHRAYERMAHGDDALARGDRKAALAEYAAASELVPDNLEIQYWHAIALATNGALDAALPRFRRVFAEDPGWIELTRRLRKPGIIPDTDEGRALERAIVSAGG